MFLLRPLLLLALTVAAPLSAQIDSVRPVRPDTVVALKRPKPITYFFKSLALPGWGQAELDRKFTGGLFIAVEGIALSMGMKAHHEAGYLERVQSNRLKDKRAERQDWFFLMAVNHLLSGMEAYVSASLFDFPADLHAQPLPGGGTGIGVTLPIGRRP